jgi:hypothetical protein
MTSFSVRSLLRSWMLGLLVVGIMLVGLPIRADAGETPVHPLNARPVVNAPRVVTGTGNDKSVFLAGQYIEVGIHNAGSFGASATPPAGFHPTDDSGRLGFVVDGDGFGTGRDPVVGDFFVPGTEEEVWGVEWNSGGSAITRMNAGLVGNFDIPTDSGYPMEVPGSTRRCVWRGVATSPQNNNEQVTITQTVSFNQTDKFFVINVVLTNSGTSSITGLKYLRSVDPDQEAEYDTDPDPFVTTLGGFATENYVVWQPPRGQLPAISPGNPPLGNTDRALVIGRGELTGVPLGLGTIDARARVSHGGFLVRSASAVLNLGIADRTAPLSDSGRESTPSVNDEAISLAFDLGNLVPGQSVSIDYAYILDAADLDVALGQLARVTILQPTGTVSGSAVFQAKTTNPDSATLKVDFYVAGILVGTDVTPSRDGTYEVTFNTLTLNSGNPLPNGPVTIEAVATFADTTTSRKSASVTVDNAGPPIGFTGATLAQDAIVVGQATIEVIGTDVENPPAQVTIFREVLGTSVVLATLTQEPFTATLDVTDLPAESPVTIKVVASGQTGASTTIYRSVISGLVPGGNTPVTAPNVPISAGDRVIYVAVSPGTPQGRTSLLSVLSGTDPNMTRAFTWDANGDYYVEVPSQPTGGFQVSTGFFIATRVPLSFNLDGTSFSAPPTLTLPPAGWVFAGVPPYDTGEGVQTTFLWSDTQVALGQYILDDTTTPTLAQAMGNAATPLDSSSSRPWHWNGSAYQQDALLETGKAYWFKNNLSQNLVLTFGQSYRPQSLTRLSGPKRSADVTVRVRDQGTPPPPPSSSAPSASASTGGGCGAGSGIAGLAFLLLLAAYGFAIVRR